MIFPLTIKHAIINKCANRAVWMYFDFDIPTAIVPFNLNAAVVNWHHCRRTGTFRKKASDDVHRFTSRYLCCRFSTVSVPINI